MKKEKEWWKIVFYAPKMKLEYVSIYLYINKGNKAQKQL